MGSLLCEFTVNLGNIETVFLRVDNCPAFLVNDDIESGLGVLDSTVYVEGLGEIEHLDEDGETGKVASAVLDGVLSSWSITAEERE